MNKTAAAIISLMAVLGIAYMAVLGGAQVREWHNESKCESVGWVALWGNEHPSLGDGFQSFHCVPAQS